MSRRNRIIPLSEFRPGRDDHFDRPVFAEPKRMRAAVGAALGRRLRRLLLGVNRTVVK